MNHRIGMNGSVYSSAMVEAAVSNSMLSIQCCWDVVEENRFDGLDGRRAEELRGIELLQKTSLNRFKPVQTRLIMNVTRVLLLS